MSNKVIVYLIFLLGLMYLFWPGPNSIQDFPPIPDSLKSDEPGDTVQSPNIVAYFSQYDRNKITGFYKNYFTRANFLIIPPIRLNHPVEEAKQLIRDEQTGTFLEEFVYPLRASIFVNGYEPEVENKMRNRPSNFFGNTILIKDNFYVSKTTLRYYPVPTLWRLIVYLGIWISILGIYRLSGKIWKERATL